MCACSFPHPICRSNTSPQILRPQRSVQHFASVLTLTAWSRHRPRRSGARPHRTAPSPDTSTNELSRRPERLPRCWPPIRGSHNILLEFDHCSEFLPGLRENVPRNVLSGGFVLYQHRRVHSLTPTPRGSPLRTQAHGRPPPRQACAACSCTHDRSFGQAWEEMMQSGGSGSRRRMRLLPARHGTLFFLITRTSTP